VSSDEALQGRPAPTPVAPRVVAVLIARNEEANIAVSIESALRALGSARADRLVDEFEVVLVDSASTDHTVSIALRYPITILRLPSSWALSAAAGRYIGFRHTSAPLVLFLDGDEELQPGWLRNALELLRSPDVAAVAGQEIEASPGTTVIAQKYRSAQRPDNLPKTIALTDSMCSGVFKREAIEEVGGIQPFLKAAEDRDLGIRLRAAGWRLLVMPEVMAKHRWSDARPFGYLDYFRSVALWSFGEGQVFRYRFRNRALRSYYLSRYVNLRYAFNFLALMILSSLGVANALAILSPAIALPVLGADGVALLTLAGIRRGRGWSWRELAYEFHAIPYSIIRYAAFLCGMLRYTPPASRYPLNAEVIRSGPVTSW